MLKPYTFDDVVNALNQVAPYDWKNFLSSRVNQIAPHAPIDGHHEGRLAPGLHGNAQTSICARRREMRVAMDAAYSIGLRLRTNDGVVTTCSWIHRREGRIGPGMQILAVMASGSRQTCCATRSKRQDRAGSADARVAER